MPLDNKISNVLGAAMPEWLKRQLKTRSKKNSQDVRDDSNLSYLANKTAWVRLISSVNINGENKPGIPTVDLDWFNKNLGTNLKLPEDLAKNYILYGGTSKYLKNTNDKSFNYELRSGIENDGAYGMLGEQEVSQYGYRPMPGITDVRIETQGRLGSVRMATINFKVWDKLQLDIMDTLYFKLGYTMLLEWANTVYYKTKKDKLGSDTSTLEYSEFDAIDPFLANTSKESIQLQISQNVRNTEGNYDAMLGIVTNFNFSFNENGGYDCSVKIIALGALGDSIKVNNPTKLPDVVKQQLTEYVAAADKAEKDRIAAEVAKVQSEKKAKQIVDVTAAAAASILPSFSNEVYRLADYIESTIYQSNLIFNYIFERSRKSSIEYINEISNGTNLFFSGANPQIGIDGDIVSLAKTKQLIDIKTEDILKETKVTVDLKYLDTIYKLVDTAKRRKNAVGDYTDLLVYDPNFDTSDIREPEPTLLTSFLPQPQAPLIPPLYKYWNEAKNATNSLTNKAIGYGDNGPGFEANGLGLRTEYINTMESFINHIQYQLNGTVYRVELAIPKVVNTTTAGAPSDLKSLKLIAPWNNISTAENNYEHYNVRDAIINAIKDSKPWKVSKKYSKDSEPTKSTGNLGDSINYREGIFIDTIRNNKGYTNVDNASQIGAPRGTLGFMLYKNVEFKIGTIVNTFDTVRGLANTLTKTKQSQLTYKFQIGLMITDAALIKSIKQENADTKETELARLSEEIATINAEKAQPTAYANQQAISDQVNAALKLQSNLELSLRAIQLYALNQALVTNSQGLVNVKSLNGADDDLKKFYSEIFKYGVYKNFLSDLIDRKIPEPASLSGNTGDNWVEAYKNLPKLDKLKIAAKYGFSSAILGGHESPTKKMEVDYNELMSVYVVPYNPNKSMDGGTKIMYSTYVQLGMVFMILNDMCTIYDTNKSDKKDTTSTPLVYIDYNPETNTCLSLPQQFTTNAFDFLIPFESSDDDYINIFPTGSYYNTVLQGKDDSSAALFPFKKSADDYVSNSLPKFRSVTDGAYSGKTMKVLIGIDYLLGLVSDFSLKDGTNSVYLKPLLEAILKDMNNYLGNANIFRLAYTDSSNTYSVVDDQFQPLFEGQDYVLSADTNDQIPVFGKKSIAKSISIQTEISSKLSNMLAISSNSNPKDQASLSANATSFGFINNSYSDRYITNKGEQVYTTKTQSKDAINSLKDASQRFNKTIKSYYSLDKENPPSRDNVSQATNFYISQMSETMAKSEATRASAMIPVSVNFTTDGISGFYMGQAFTLPPEMMPYSYTQRTTVDSPKDENKVAFATVGVTHEISNNVWQTSIKGSMILIKDKRIFSGGALNSDGAPLNRSTTAEAYLSATLQNSSNIGFSAEKGGSTKIIEGILYNNGNMPEDKLTLINNPSKYIGALSSDEGRIRLYPTVATAINKLLVAAEKDKITLKINSAYRTVPDQKRVFRENCINACCSRECTPKDDKGKAAIPGTSNHGFAIAVDFANYQARRVNTSMKEYIWLSQNAATYGFKRIASETWHWEYQFDKK